MRRQTPFVQAAAHGFSLVEAVASIAIVGVAIVAALHTVGGAARALDVGLTQQLGPALAHDLMAEILPLAYEDPDATPEFGTEPGEHDDAGTRIHYDDLDDYDGWRESPPRRRDGTVLTDAGGWTREVSVQWVPASDLSAVSVTDSGLKRIAVTVTDPRGKKTVVTALRSNVGGFDVPVETDRTFIAKVGVTLRTGDDVSSVMHIGTPLLNIPSPPVAADADPTPDPFVTTGYEIYDEPIIIEEYPSPTEIY